MPRVPAIRFRITNEAAPDPGGDYVLYWMTAYRRVEDNFSLQRALEWARELNKPLLVLEALRCDYRWASDRLHRFVMEGMADNQAACEKNRGVLYYPYLETQRGEGKGLLQSLAEKACVVIGDDYPAFFLPRMISAASRQVRVRFELVDANGLLPMRATDRLFSRAFDFRRFLQRELLPHLMEAPVRQPLSRCQLPQLESLPRKITSRWPVADPIRQLASTASLEHFSIDHSVVPTEMQGGSSAARSALRAFLRQKLSGYDTDRNQPQQQATSRLSPYLHFGHISPHRVFSELTTTIGWTPACVAGKATGSRAGWWGSTPDVEAFLDQLITWRELGFNMCWQRDDYDRYESLPAWAQRTLAEHAGDQRQYVYTDEDFDNANTHDPLWNACQRQLVQEGYIHNYLRMLWGKKILEWSASPREALRTMIDLNNRYALDGRDPNSYSGIFWVLGRYDRAWGPERPIFGKVRYMSSQNTARKVKVKEYLEQYAACEAGPKDHG